VEKERRYKLLEQKAQPLKCYGINSEVLYSFMILKVPFGQTGSAWEWYPWIGLEKDINHHRRKKMNLTSCLFGTWFVYLQAVILSVSRILPSFSMMRAILYFCLYYCITVLLYPSRDLNFAGNCSGLDCGMLEFFTKSTSEPLSKEQLLTPPQ